MEIELEDQKSQRPLEHKNLKYNHKRANAKKVQVDDVSS